MRRSAAMLLAVALIGIGITAARGSGGPDGPMLRYIDSHGGTPSERARLYAGRLGVIQASSPKPLLYLQWRLLNHLRVGPEAGAALSGDCCDTPVSSGPTDGVFGWVAAVRRVPNAPFVSDYLSTERQGPHYTTIPNCFRDAFDTATATLNDRARRFGLRSAALLAWVRTQSAVFDACGDARAALPPAIPGAPAWLSADRAYQEAAFALYNGRNLDAANRFAAIARDGSSPWQSRALYLRVRAIRRDALSHPDAASFARARVAIRELAATPPGTYGRSEIYRMRRSLAYRDHPDALLGVLDRELNQAAPYPDIAVSLRDYLSLSPRRTPRPDIADWLDTMKAYDQKAALAHARARWAATRKLPWLVATLSLVPTEDPGAAGLAADAARVPATSPAWLTAQYHQMRLTLATADPAAIRRRTDAILARDLSRSDRNIFLSLRTQVATSLGDVLRLALREPYCLTDEEHCAHPGWAEENGSFAASMRRGRAIGLAPDARLILDRLPLPERMAAGRDRRLPAAIRLDLALTNYARAVHLQDDAAIDGMAGDLAVLMPAMRQDWRAITVQRPGEGKRFAEFFVLAKIPGVATDLNDLYTRPTGSVRQYHGIWWDRAILPRGKDAGAVEPAWPGGYYQWTYSVSGYQDDSGMADLTCLGLCGAGAAPFHLPRFVAERTARAATERRSFVIYGDNQGPTKFPPGTVSAWEEVLHHAAAHPRDPRSPEALYWLIRISRWGRSHDRLGYRAFVLLHRRYAGSAWVRRTPYYFD
jgi:hypothetical protein